jgi:hypothetical protein
LVASVSISSTPVPAVAGTVTFTATPVNGGTPTYQWKKNGTNIQGATNATYTGVVASGDVITVVMTSNLADVTGSPATSNAITVGTGASQASVSIVATQGSTTTTATITATPTNGGTNPTYQWKKNGTNITGANSVTYTYTPSNGDVITVVMTSNLAGVTGSPATSNAITMTVNTPVVSVSINVLPSNTVSAGTSVTFTATPVNGGTTPVYQWKNKGTNIAGANSATYTYTPSNGDVVTVKMATSMANTTGSPAFSNAITMTVNINATAPQAPTGLTGTFSGATASLLWTAPTNNGGSPVTGYNVDYKLVTATTWSTTTSTTTSKSITGLLPGQSYDYRVSAVNAIGAGPSMSITAPSKPLNLIATPSNGKVVLNWTAPISDGGSPIVYYLMRHKLSSAVDWLSPVSIPVTSTTYTVTGLTNGTSYDFRVRAMASSTGAWSDITTTSPIAKISPSD